MLELIACRGAEKDAELRRASAEMAAMEGITMMLTVANDALLEGRSAGIDAGQLVDVLDTLRRLTFAVGNLARFAPEADGAPAATLEAVRARFDSWLSSLREQTDAGVPSRAPLRQMVSNADAPRLDAPEDRVAPASAEPLMRASRRLTELTLILERRLTGVSLY